MRVCVEIELRLRELRGRGAHRGVLRARLAERAAAPARGSPGRHCTAAAAVCRLGRHGLGALLGNQLLLGELDGALLVGLRIAQLRGALRHLRARRGHRRAVLRIRLVGQFELRLGGVDRELVGLRIDLEQQLAVLHRLLVAHPDRRAPDPTPARRSRCGWRSRRRCRCSHRGATGASSGPRSRWPRPVTSGGERPLDDLCRRNAARGRGQCRPGRRTCLVVH